MGNGHRHLPARNRWPHAERRALNGNQDRGDIAGVPGCVIEAKNAKTINLAGWLDEANLERDNDRADLGVVWFKRRGKVSPGRRLRPHGRCHVRPAHRDRRLLMRPYTIKCPSCSGCGFLTDGWTDGVALERQTCSTDEDCPRCEGSGRVPFNTTTTAPEGGANE